MGGTSSTSNANVISENNFKEAIKNNLIEMNSLTDNKSNSIDYLYRVGRIDEEYFPNRGPNDPIWFAMNEDDNKYYYEKFINPHRQCIKYEIEKNANKKILNLRNPNGYLNSELMKILIEHIINQIDKTIFIPKGLIIENNNKNKYDIFRRYYDGTLDDGKIDDFIFKSIITEMNRIDEIKLFDVVGFLVGKRQINSLNYTSDTDIPPEMILINGKIKECLTPILGILYERDSRYNFINFANPIYYSLEKPSRDIPQPEQNPSGDISQPEQKSIKAPGPVTTPEKRAEKKGKEGKERRKEKTRQMREQNNGMDLQTNYGGKKLKRKTMKNKKYKNKKVKNKNKNYKSKKYKI